MEASSRSWVATSRPLPRDAGAGASSSEEPGLPPPTVRWAGTRDLRHRPGLAALAVVVAGWFVLSAALVALGLAMTAWVLDGPLGRWDDDVARWFAQRRTPLATAISAWGSRLSDTLVVVTVTALAAGVLLLRRRRPDALLVVLAPTVEVTAFLVATFLVDRDRPPVPRLDDAPPTSSFPSGHVAAAVAIYVALALVACRRASHPSVRVAVWLVALVAPVCVAWSRLYRGMHHPTDVIVGYAAGLACVYVAVLAVRVARAPSTTPLPPSVPHPEEALP